MIKYGKFANNKRTKAAAAATQRKQQKKDHVFALRSFLPN